MSNTAISGRRCAFGRIFRPFVAACLAACATVAQSATPIAVWDGDFGSDTRANWTVNYNSNSTDGGVLTVDQNFGAVFTGPNSSLNNSTFIIKCSGLDLTSANNQYLLSLHQNILGGGNGDASYNKVGVSLAANNAAVRGIWNNAVYTTEGDGFQIASPLTTGTYLAINIQTSGGVFVWEISEDESGNRTLTKVYGNTDLKASNTNYKGFTLGGIYEKASSTLSPATGWTVEKLAVFGSTLAEADILAYEFPSEVADEMYHNRLSTGDAVIPSGSYGAIRIPGNGYKATAFTAATKLSNTASGEEIAGSYSGIISHLNNNTDVRTHTLMGWFKIDALPTAEGVANAATIYVAKSADGNYGGYKVAVGSDGKVYIGQCDNDNWRGNQVSTTTGPIEAGKWFHLAISMPGCVVKDVRSSTAAVFVNGNQIEVTSGTFSVNLNGNSCQYVRIGTKDVTSDLGISAAGIYVDKTNIVDATVVQRLATSTEVVMPIPYEFTATVGSSAAFSQLAWNPAMPTGGFTEHDKLVITNTATATLTLDTPVTAAVLKVVSASGMMLTLKKNENVETRFDAFDFAEAADGVGFDARTAELDAGATLLDYARTHDEKLVFYGSGANGALLDYGTATYDNTTIQGHYVFDGGTHTFQRISESENLLFAANATAENPTFWVKDGATLNWKARNPCGWSAAASDAGIVRIGNGSKVVPQITSENAGTWYWSQQFYFEDGSTLEIGTTGDNFRTVGNNADKPHFYMPASGGTAQITGGAANYLTIPANNYAAMNFEVGKDSTLSVSAAMKTLADGKPFGKYGEGTLALTGDLSAFGAAIAVSNGVLKLAPTVYLKNAATLAIAKGAKLVLDAGSSVITNRCQITNGGTIEVAGGTVIFMEGTFGGTITTSGSGKVLYGYTVDVNMLGVFPIPEGKTADQIRLFDKNGNEVAATGHDETNIYFDLDLYGKSCLMEYLYKGNLVSTGTDTGAMQFDGTHCFSGNEYVTNALGEKAGGIYAASAPWRDVSFPSEVTVVMYGKMMATSNTCQIGIGSTTGGSKYSLFLASGDVTKNEVVLGYAYKNEKGVGNVEKSGILCRMTVPNAQTAAHLYVFTMQQVDGNTEVHVYLDGAVLQPYTFDSTVTLGSGIQLGSIHGGVGDYQDWPDDFGFKRSTAVETEATLSFLRVYDQRLNDDVIKRIAEDYPYVSSNGKATRTIGANGTWKQTGTWLQRSQAGVETTQDAPNADTVVGVTMTGDATVEMNLDEQANYEQFAVGGSGTLTLAQGAGAVAPIVVGRSTIGANVTVAYESFLFGGNVDIAEGKSLTFDFTSLDLGTYWEDTTIKLTGLATLGDGATVNAVNLTQKPCRTATLALNDQTKQYELQIVVSKEPFVGTVAAGASTCNWTWGGYSIAESDVDAHPSIAIRKEGAGTLSKELANGRSYVVNAGTFRATNAAERTSSVTVNKNATFDFNGSVDGYVAVTLNGGSLVNDGAVMGTGNRQMTGLTLTAASTIGGTGDFGLVSSQYKANTLDLGGYVLTKTGTNTFFLCNTTIANGGSIDIRSGIIEVFKTSSFAEGSVKNAGTLRIDEGAALTVGKVSGGTIENGGTLSAISLGGEVTLTGAGAYGVITLVDNATADVVTRRGLSIGGSGKINVVLTEEETVSSTPISLYEPVAGSSVTLGRVVDAFGNDLTYKYRLDGGTLAACQAKIGDVLYETLALAMEAVKDGQTIVLLASAELSGTVTNTCAIDINGYALSCGNVDIKGALAFNNSVVGTGAVSVGGVLSVSGGAASRLVLNAQTVSGGGSVTVKSGALVNEGVTSLDGIDLTIERGGRLDLSAGTEVRCRDFASSGEIVGTKARLAVAGNLDASVPVTLARLALGDAAVLQGVGLVVTNELSLGSTLRFRYNPIKEGLRVATVPAGTAVSGTSLFVNDEVTGSYAFYVNPGDTALRLKKADEVLADVRLSVDPDTNEVNRVDFGSAVISGEIHLHGDEGESEVDDVMLIAYASDGSAVTQRVSQVSEDGKFTYEFTGLDAGKTYLFSAYANAAGRETPVTTVVRKADFVSARSIDGVDGWIYEDAETFAGIKPGTGVWTGTNSVACATNGIISLFADDWVRSAEFQPTNMSLEISSSFIKDLHFHVLYGCPGFYLYEPWPGITNSVSAAFTLVADEDDNCCFAVVSNGVWSIVPRTVFPPEFDTPYEVLVRLDGMASNIQYSVVVDGDLVRIATCPVVESRDVSLDLTGSGEVSLIEGVAQDAHLAQVGEEEFWTIGEAIDAAGGTNNVIPLWWSRYVVAGDGGAFRIWDPNGYLQLIWQKWHHWGLEDGVYRFISGNNWIEYADESGVVKESNGALLVTNEFGLAWVAAESTNRWIREAVSIGENLDLSSKNWTPIAQFAGSFDGCGHTIVGLNNVHVIYTNLLGSAGYYFSGPTNDWDYVAYGLFSSATNASFANVTFEDVAISNVSDSAATLLGVHAGGALSVTNVKIASGRVFGEGRAVAGILTVGGQTNDDIVVTRNVNRATVAGTIVNDSDGGNVAQVLAGTSWDTIFLGNVVATNNVGAGDFDVEWINHDGYHFELPVCNFAAAVTRVTDEGYYRRFVEANEPSSVPIDPVHLKARMLAGTFPDGADNVAGWWTDTITAMEEGGHVDIVGAGTALDLWEPIFVDRDVSLNLNGNFAYMVYDDDVFMLSNGAKAVISNGTIVVSKAYKAFAGDVSNLETNNVTVVFVDEDFYHRTYDEDEDGVLLMQDFLPLFSTMPSGSSLHIPSGTGLSVDVTNNALLLDGVKVGALASYRSLANVSPADSGTDCVVELNDNAVPEFGLDVQNTVSSDGKAVITLSGTRKGLYYAVQRKASLVEKDWSDASEWKYAEDDDVPVSFSLPASDSSGFYRIKVTDYLSDGE